MADDDDGAEIEDEGEGPLGLDRAGGNIDALDETAGVAGGSENEAPDRLTSP